ncbi:uncharacterized protein BT62DRAFT_932879 [Guyanagaster necrorhizus]|uniref:RRM domain-containing protein n=1 Tax=Guyanagaster necrorhizus TaxID=856835 RepID=A0A9P7VSM4_9AGAR|nr:uncharacterized protein BT62DRAFT_932879 [Guyanagaster necrorhizus MCA 3950]KAG7445725.1 hypothetical protein BT62DRAFT_932879 [Guyanagaster necrorhizus MCA 3950]
MLHFIQRRCLNRPLRLYRTLSTASRAVEIAPTNHEFRPPQARQRTSPPPPVFSRSLYIYDLPANYDATHVVNAIGEEPIHRISLGKDHMYVNFWTPTQASRVVNRTGGMLTVTGNHASLRFNKTAQDLLLATSVAHLGVAKTTRAIYIFGESVKAKSLEGWEELVLQYGPLESINFGTQKDGSTFLVVTFLSAEHARKAMSALKHGHTVKYRRDFEAAQKPDVKRRVMLSGLSPTLSTTLLTNHILDIIASIGHGEKIVKITRSGPKIGKAVVDFTLPTQARLFYESFQAANSNPYGLTVELNAIRPVSSFLFQAIHCGANRTIRLYTGKEEIPRDKLMEDFNTMGHTTQVYSRAGTAFITFSSLSDSLKVVSDLAAGRHDLEGYTGFSVTFAKNDLQAALKSAVVAEPKGIRGEEELEGEADPADIIVDVMASEPSSEQRSETTPVSSEIGEVTPTQDIEFPADVPTESPARTEPVPPSSSA